MNERCYWCGKLEFTSLKIRILSDQLSSATEPFYYKKRLHRAFWPVRKSGKEFPVRKAGDVRAVSVFFTGVVSYFQERLIKKYRFLG